MPNQVAPTGSRLYRRLPNRRAMAMPTASQSSSHAIIFPGFYRPAPPESAPVSPSQTFEIYKFSRKPRAGGGKKPALLASDFGFRISFGFRPSAFGFPSASAPVSPSQTFEIYKFSRKPRAGGGKKPALLASDFGFRISFGFRPSAFGFPLGVSPSQTRSDL